MFIFAELEQALVDEAVDMVQLCVRDICIWMGNHFPKLNDAKSEVLIVGSRQQVAKVKITGVTFGNTMITPSARLRDLRVVFDTELTMVDHVNTVSRTADHQIRMIGRIRRFLCLETWKLIVHR